MKILPFTVLMLFIIIFSLCAQENTNNLRFRTMFEETIGLDKAPRLDSDQKKWLTALPAIIMVNNKSLLSDLKVEEINDESVKKWLVILSRDWGINNREELLETISMMEYHGHNSSYASTKHLLEKYEHAFVAKVAENEPLSDRKINYYNFLLKNSDEYKSIDLLAWDLGRMTSLIRWGYQVGFLDEAESWNMLVYFGKKIQHYYRSWEEYGIAYALGRIFWASGFGEEKKFREITTPIITQLLLENGLWAELKWNQKLPECEIKILSQEELVKLIQRSKEIDSMLNVSAEKYTSVYFELGNYYSRTEKYNSAIEIYKKGLRLNSRDWEVQLRTAKIERFMKKIESAFNRIENILNNCDDPIILSEASDINFNMDSKIKLIPENYDKYIIIQVYGYVPDYIVTAIESKIRDEFKINTKRGPLKLKLSTKNYRSSEVMFNRYIDAVFSNVKKDPKLYAKIIRALKLQNKKSLSEMEKQNIVKYLYGSDKEGQTAWNNLKEKIKPQYNAEFNRNELMTNYSNMISKEGVIGVLGITAEDIFAKDYNFLFGWNGSKGAIMSVYRFFTAETPLTTIIKRSVMQGLSSTGFIIGIPRCTVADCARAYSSNLEDHDNKDDILCSECKNALIKKYTVKTKSE